MKLQKIFETFWNSKKFFKVYSGTLENVPNNFQIIVHSLPRTSLSIYVNHFIRKENVHAVPRLIEVLKSEFRGLLKAATWMSNQTVALLSKRIGRFTSDTGGPLSREDRLLEKIHADQTTTFYVMRRNFHRFSAKEAMDFVLGEQEMAMDMEETAAKANFNNKIPARSGRFFLLKFFSIKKEYL